MSAKGFPCGFTVGPSDSCKNGGGGGGWTRGTQEQGTRARLEQSHVGVWTQVWVGSDFQSSYTDSEPPGGVVVMGSGENTETI